MAADEPDLRSDHTKAMEAIAAENQKIPKVDSNGYPVDLDYTAQQWTTDVDGNPVHVPPADPPAAGADA